MTKILKLAIPSGIGDSLWVMTKVESLLRKSNYDKVAITVCSDPLRRAEDFLKSFTFVESVGYCDWQITQHPHILENGCYNYGQCQPNWHNEFDWFLQANSHLEHGNRLETWIPELDINWDIMQTSFIWDKEVVNQSKSLKAALGDYCVFYLGPELGNTNATGHNRGPLWHPEDWSKLYLECQRLEIEPIIVGASYDKSYWEKYFLNQFFWAKGAFVRLGDWSIQQTLSVVKNAKFIIGYQSGIPITGAYMGVCGGAFWRPHGSSIAPDRFISFSENMASGWVPSKMLKSNKWLPLIYTKCTPESILKHAKEYWL